MPEMRDGGQRRVEELSQNRELQVRLQRGLLEWEERRRTQGYLLSQARQEQAAQVRQARRQNPSNPVQRV